MSELLPNQWRDVTVNGEEMGMECRPEEGKYQIGHRYGSPADPGHVVLLTDGQVTYHGRPINPRSTARTSTGRAAIADWREYGKPTGSEVTVRESNGTVVYRTELEESSPYIALSDDGAYLAISPYCGKTRVIDLETENLVTLHHNLIDDRQKPQFVGSDPELRFARDGSDSLTYGITLDDTLVWESDEFADHRFIEALSLEAGIDWEEACEHLLGAYTSGNAEMRRRVTDTLANASLTNIKTAAELTTIRDSLEPLFVQAKTEDDERAVAIPLGETHYRLARAHKRDRVTDACEAALKEAIHYANIGLPWYRAKNLLAKCYRFKARLAKQRGEREKARRNIERVFELEEEFGVQLTNEADENLREQLLH